MINVAATNTDKAAEIIPRVSVRVLTTNDEKKKQINKATQGPEEIFKSKADKKPANAINNSE